jgi:hypothetical protein
MTDTGQSFPQLVVSVGSLVLSSGTLLTAVLLARRKDVISDAVQGRDALRQCELDRERLERENVSLMRQLMQEHKT